MDLNIQKLLNLFEKIKENEETFTEHFMLNRNDENSEVIQLQKEICEKSTLSKKCTYAAIIISSLMNDLYDGTLTLEQFNMYLMSPPDDFVIAADRLVASNLSGLRTY